MPTDSLLFGVVLINTTIVMGALTFFPALALGPLAEHVGMVSTLPLVAR